MTLSQATVTDVLTEARSAGIDRIDAQLLLCHALGRPRSWLVAHGDAVPDGPQLAWVRDGLRRRCSGEPLAYILGWQEFHGLLLAVDNGVLVPRPDTELIVDWALELLASVLVSVARPRVVDLGTGSGAIGLAVKHGRPGIDMLATDASAPALAIARANAGVLGLRVRFVAGSWWQPLAGLRFHLALSNPPYIAAGDPHLPALRHEPALALTPGGDGLGALREIVRDAANHLEAGGWLLLEHGFDQAPQVQALLREAGFSDVQTRIDLAGQPRCTGAHR